MVDQREQTADQLSPYEAQFKNLVADVMPNAGYQLLRDLKQHPLEIEFDENMFNRGSATAQVEGSDYTVQIKLKYESDLESDKPESQELIVEEGVHALHFQLNPDLAHKASELNQLHRQEQVLYDRKATDAPLLLKNQSQAHVLEEVQRFAQRVNLELPATHSNREIALHQLGMANLSNESLLRVAAAVRNSDHEAFATLQADEVFDEHYRSLRNDILRDYDLAKIMSQESQTDNTLEVAPHEAVADPTVVSTETGPAEVNTIPENQAVYVTTNPDLSSEPTKSPRIPSLFSSARRTMWGQRRSLPLQDMDSWETYTSPREALVNTITEALQDNRVSDTEIETLFAKAEVPLNSTAEQILQFETSINEMTIEECLYYIRNWLDQPDLKESELYLLAYALEDSVYSELVSASPETQAKVHAEIITRLKSRHQAFTISPPEKANKLHEALRGASRTAQRKGMARTKAETALLNLSIFSDFNFPMDEADIQKFQSPGYMEKYLQVIRETIADPNFDVNGIRLDQVTKDADIAQQTARLSILDAISEGANTDQLDIVKFLADVKSLMSAEINDSTDYSYLLNNYQMQIDELWRRTRCDETQLASLGPTALSDSMELAQLQARSRSLMHDTNLMMEPVAKVVSKLASRRNVADIDFGGGMMGGYSELIAEGGEDPSSSIHAWMQEMAVAFRKDGYPALKRILQQTSFKAQRAALKSI